MSSVPTAVNRPARKCKRYKELLAACKPSVSFEPTAEDEGHDEGQRVDRCEGKKDAVSWRMTLHSGGPLETLIGAKRAAGAGCSAYGQRPTQLRPSVPRPASASVIIARVRSR